MNFQDLHELLRLELLRRIERGDLTGTRLASQTEFQQGHVSNFLNRKRALSLDGLDRVLAAQCLTIDELLPLHLSASSDHSGQQPVAATETDSPERADNLQEIPVVSFAAAADQPQILPASIIQSIQISASLLSERRAFQGRRTMGWQRFVAIRADAQQAAAMEPVLSIGCIAVIDRHYNSLAPHHAHQPSPFAIRYGPGLIIRYIEFETGQPLLRPSSVSHPIQLLEVAGNQSASDYIIGRVCLIIDEL